MASGQVAVKGKDAGDAAVTDKVVEAVAKACEAGLKALESWSQYQIVREQRYAIEAKLEAEIRKSEIELEALHARLQASVEYLRQNQIHNAANRAFFAKSFDAGHEAVKVYVKLHANLLLTAKSPDDMERAELIWQKIAVFVEQMNEATRLVSRQTLAWLE